MPGNRKLQRNGGLSNSSAADKVGDVIRRLKIESSDDNGGVGEYPERPGEPDCIYYLRTGTCGYGTKCRFNHPCNARGQVYGVKNIGDLPERVGQPECVYYLKTGTCKYGSTCEYHHPKDRKADSSVLLNILGLPMRQPTSTANVSPVVGPTYGSGGSAFVPTTAGASSVGELSTASLSKATYLSTSLHFPQSYMPLFLPGSQSWNTYAGSFSPLSVTSVLTGPASNGQLSVSYFPERPDQPECRYFMNHGSCKYGSDCRYHHPKEKIVQLASSSIGPLGLPLRPGQPVCLYYGLYGLCKYGPTCKFDHPLDGYSYAYSLSVPPLPTSYSSSSTYQSMSSLVPSSDTSPSKSSKSSDWIKKGATMSNKNRQL